LYPEIEDYQGVFEGKIYLDSSRFDL